MSTQTTFHPERITAIPAPDCFVISYTNLADGSYAGDPYDNDVPGFDPDTTAADDPRRTLHDALLDLGYDSSKEPTSSSDARTRDLITECAEKLGLHVIVYSVSRPASLDTRAAVRRKKLGAKVVLDTHPERSYTAVEVLGDGVYSTVTPGRYANADPSLAWQWCPTPKQVVEHYVRDATTYPDTPKLCATTICRRETDGHLTPITWDDVLDTSVRKAIWSDVRDVDARKAIWSHAACMEAVILGLVEAGLFPASPVYETELVVGSTTMPCPAVLWPERRLGIGVVDDRRLGGHPGIYGRPGCTVVLGGVAVPPRAGAPAVRPYRHRTASRVP